MRRNSSPNARAVVEPLDLPTSVEAAVVSFAQTTGSAILESSLGAAGYGRFTILACDPVDEFVLHDESVDASPAGATIVTGAPIAAGAPIVTGAPNAAGARIPSRTPFHRLARHIETYPPMADPGVGLPFAGGWIGFITYEAGLGLERIACTPRPESSLPTVSASQEDRRFGWHGHARAAMGLAAGDTCPHKRGHATQDVVHLPTVAFRLYDSAAIYDHLARQWYLVAVDWPRPIADARPKVSARLAALRQKLAAATAMDSSDRARCGTGFEPVEHTGYKPVPHVPVPHVEAVPNMSREAYFARFARAKRYIEAGDIYQVNLTQRWTVRTDVTPLDLYSRLRAVSPSSHAALLRWGEFSILSSSPELFLDLRKGHVITRPIKGTRPRVGDPVLDDTSRRELLESEKERAELTMIIDLLRNDLGRVCSFGSVRVSDAGALEEHPTVFHRVATIEGDLEEGRTWLDLLLASFPGGSVTGAPKIRAMQIIDELEPTARGVYCGSIGMIGLDGSMSMNIAIRTIVQVGSVAYVHTGGAIVADSTAQQEYDETIAKAAGMLRALGCEESVSGGSHQRQPPGPTSMEAEALA